MPQESGSPYSSTHLPEEQVPQDLTGCKVETPIGSIGTVLGNNFMTTPEDGKRWVDFGRGDIGTRPEELLRQRVVSIPTQPQEN